MNVSNIILIIIGLAGLWACSWLYRAGWSRCKKYKTIDRDTVCRASEKNGYPIDKALDNFKKISKSGELRDVMKKNGI